MSDFALEDLQRKRQQIRDEALRRRNQVADGESLSLRVFDRLTALPEYARARTILMYLDVRSEVRTRWYLPTLWAEGRRIVIPYCWGEELALFHVTSLDQLAPRTMQILEPRRELLEMARHEVAPTELDLVIVPGVAFDRRGNRLGYGKGFFDKLLHQVRPGAAKIAVCFECQVVPEIPTLPHDIPMDKVITEETVYPQQA
jgi:5-formyltetrahydrofolate cyclo-ligase